MECTMHNLKKCFVRSRVNRETHQFRSAKLWPPNKSITRTYSFDDVLRCKKAHKCYFTRNTRTSSQGGIGLDFLPVSEETQDEIACFRISETWRKHAAPWFRYIYVLRKRENSNLRDSVTPLERKC